MLHIQNLTWWYSSSKNIFENFSLNLEKWDFCFLLWKSGSGKTSLIKMIMWQLTIPRETIRFDWKDLSTMKKSEMQSFRAKMWVIFQDFRLVDRQTVEQNIKIHKNQDESYLHYLYAQLWLKDKLKEHPKTLSGWEKQRVAICRAVAHKPILLLADEPTWNLDFENTKSIWKILIDLHKEWQTILCITHNDQLVERIQKQINSRVIVI